MTAIKKIDRDGLHYVFGNERDVDDLLSLLTLHYQVPFKRFTNSAAHIGSYRPVILRDFSVR